MRNPFSVSSFEVPQCTHEWNMISKTYAPPSKVSLSVANIPQDLSEKMAFGLTTYLWECKICSALRKEEMLGSDENQLQDIYEKINKFGMQYLREGDKVYAITEWVPA